MNTALRIAAIVFVVAGLIVLGVNGTFSITDTDKVGPFTIHDTDTFNFPVWGGWGMLAVGVGMFLVTLMPKGKKPA